jgi:sulfur carrier protein
MTCLTLTINGKKYQSSSHLTIFSLLLYLGFKLNLIVIDYNGTVLPREWWSKTILNDKDNIEILTIAGGG